MKPKIGVKIIFSLFLFGLLGMPVLALAQDLVEPGTREAAEAEAQTQAASKTEEKKPSAAENINVELKVPLPFVKTTDGKVQNLKDYIEGVYRLLIGAGALFAVVMIIIAGYQWMLSGGSADKTGAAKKRIWNASIGLVLALLSYIILNTISARLVELRLPAVDPVPPFYSGAGEFCKDDKAIVNLYNASTDQTHFLTEIGSSLPGVGLYEGKCGKKYNLADNKGQCMGDICPANQTCVDNKCGNIIIKGTIEWQPLGTDSFVDYVYAHAVCGNRTTAIVGQVDVPERARKYDLISYLTPIYQKNESNGENTVNQIVYIPAYQQAEKQCVSEGKTFKGFVLEIEVNDDLGTWTNDDDFAVGRNCNQSIHPNNVYDFDSIDWGQVNEEDLISIKQLESGAFACNLIIDRNQFPAR